MAFNLFGGAAKQAPAVQTPQNQGTPAPQQQQQPGGRNNPENASGAVSGKQNNKIDANGLIPDGQNQNQNAEGNDAGGAAKNPLDKFSELFKDNPTPEGAPKKTNPFDVSSDKILEAARKTDFSKLIKPEVLKSIVGDNQEAGVALTSLFNEMGQHVFAQAIGAGIKISERTYNKAKTDFEADLPSHLKKHNLSNNLRGKNPAYKHPAVQPLIDGLVGQFSQKYPNADTAELQGMAEDYLQTIGVSFSPKGEEDTGKGGVRGSRPEQDFSTFLDDMEL